MMRDELQLVADTLWVTIGLDGFGCSVSVSQDNSLITIDVAGWENGTMFHFSETFLRFTIEQMHGDPRYNYIREIARACRKAITDLRMTQIKMSLGE